MSVGDESFCAIRSVGKRSGHYGQVRENFVHPTFGLSHSPLPGIQRQNTSCAWRTWLWTRYAIGSQDVATSISKSCLESSPAKFWRPQIPPQTASFWRHWAFLPAWGGRKAAQFVTNDQTETRTKRCARCTLEEMSL